MIPAFVAAVRAPVPVPPPPIPAPASAAPLGPVPIAVTTAFPQILIDVLFPALLEPPPPPPMPAALLPDVALICPPSITVVPPVPITTPPMPALHDPPLVISSPVLPICPFIVNVAVAVTAIPACIVPVVAETPVHVNVFVLSSISTIVTSAVPTNFIGEVAVVRLVPFNTNTAVAPVLTEIIPSPSVTSKTLPFIAVVITCSCVAAVDCCNVSVIV